MPNLLRKCFFRIRLRIHKIGITGALALHHRNEVRCDGLVLKHACNRLEICWEARAVHPWDDNLPPLENENAFAKQVLEDTEAAVIRLFERLPEIDVLEIKVVAPRTGDVLANGAIPREALNESIRESRSIRMRLGDLGIRCCLGYPQLIKSDSLESLQGSCEHAS